jgi:predicted GNAT family N-acyltransferase
MGINYSKEHFDADKGVRNFRTLNYTSYGRGYTAFSPNEAIIGHSMEMARQDVPGLASLDDVMRVYRYNPDTISAFAREWSDAPGAYPIGILAHLPLTHEGAVALFNGELDTARPDLKFICRPHQRAAALYFWFIHLPKGHGGGLSLVMEKMTSDKNRDLPIFCKAANEKAKAFFEKMGFRMGATYERLHSRTLMSCEMPDPAARRKPYDNYIPGAHAGTKKPSVTVVHSLDDLLKCIAIRGAAYVEERGIPYQEDVDGNDYSATHLLGYVGDEPAGCIRLRYFGDFIKIERLAVLPRCRGGLAMSLVRAAIAFGQDKGFRRFYGQAAAPVLKLWKHFGFTQRDGEGLSYLTDEVYYEMDLVTDRGTLPLHVNSGAAVLVRPEGQWDRPGPLEALSPTPWTQPPSPLVDLDSGWPVPTEAQSADAAVPDKALGSAAADKWVPGVSPTTMYPDRDIPGCVNPFYGESPTCGPDSWPPLIYGRIPGLNC